MRVEGIDAAIGLPLTSPRSVTLVPLLINDAVKLCAPLAGVKAKVPSRPSVVEPIRLLPRPLSNIDTLSKPGVLLFTTGVQPEAPVKLL